MLNSLVLAVALSTPAQYHQYHQYHHNCQPHGYNYSVRPHCYQPVQPYYHQPYSSQPSLGRVYPRIYYYQPYPIYQAPRSGFYFQFRF